MKDGILQVGQIGCGAFAAAQDMRNFERNPRLTCTWCCDVDRDRAAALAEKHGVPHVTVDYRDVVADPDVDFIKVATTHEVHLPIIEAAAAAGKHVFCEKPLALDEREALLIIRAVRRSGIKLCVDFNRRRAPALQALRKQWAAQRENPRHQPWRYVETVRGPFPEEEQTHLLVRVQDETASYRLAHMDPLKGGGMLMGETVHWLDLSCWLYAPRVPVQIEAWGSRRFSHGVHLTFSGGDTSTILFHCGGTFDYPKELYEVTCKGALLRSEHFVENRYYGIPGLDRELFPLQRDPLPEVGREGGVSGYLAKWQARVKGLTNAKQGFSSLNADKGWEAMLDGFADAIVRDTDSPCDEIAGFVATYLAQLAIQSLETRQALPIPVDRITPSVL